jgi:hypothetical protein
MNLRTSVQLVGGPNQVVDSFDLFVEGHYSILSDPVPKIFKLSSCKKAFGCINFETTLIEVAQHFVQVCQNLIEISY